MSDYETKYDVCYREAMRLLDSGETMATVYKYIDSLREEDYRDHTLMRCGKLQPSAWEKPAIFLQVSDELWSLGERDEANQLLHRAIELAKQPPQPFEASKTLAGCVRLLVRWGRSAEAMAVAESIASPEQRKTVLREIEEKSNSS